jgi:hypothetical protein
MYDYFMRDMAKPIEELRIKVEELKYIAKDYYGYDFSEDLSDMLNDICLKGGEK